jgi:hypothetical protein
MARARGTKTGIYRSKFESRFSTEMKDLKMRYEVTKLSYEIPATKHVYHPDFTVSKYVHIETKGVFGPKDRSKLLFIKEQHPEHTVILVFMNPNLLLGKRLGTCIEWAKKNGFPAFGEKDVIELRNFLKELKNAPSQTPV